MTCSLQGGTPRVAINAGGGTGHAGAFRRSRLTSGPASPATWGASPWGGFSIVPGLRSDVTLILASRFPRLLRHLINVIARDARAATRCDGATIAAE